ncbi:MAG: hypothetical protein IKM11_04075 [Oscillospiraceae bacterium]|nr:hypothetical protein [Oscillospiraceae bacterium]
MNKKAVVNFLQNITLLTLSVTAVLLLMQFPMLEGVIGGKVREILSTPESNVERSVDLSGAITSLHLVVTDEMEFGRYTQINASSDGAEFQKVEPLLRGAIGSATVGREATHAEFRTALETPGIYVDLMTPLPISVVAAWLGEEFAGEDSIRALALTTARETALLFFLRQDGSIVRCESALTSSAVREVTATFAQNGGQFAYESEYSALSPYTVLVQTVNDATQITASIPAGYSAYNLLSALGLNAHTNSRYFESSGTEVIMQAPHFLWIGTDGTVRYSSDGEVTESMYRIVGEGEEPDAVEALQGAYLLAQALSSGTDAAPLSLEYVEKTETGWVVSFGYRLNGVRVRLGNERAALKVVISGDVIREFDYYCRAYTPTQDSVSLLPPLMAVAIASMQEGAELALLYVDTGVSVHGAHWFAE